jgi:hypothetical protein
MTPILLQNPSQFIERVAESLRDSSESRVSEVITMMVCPSDPPPAPFQGAMAPGAADLYPAIPLERGQDLRRLGHESEPIR